MRDLIKNATMEMVIKGKTFYKFSLVEMPYVIHKSEYSDHGVKRHMTCQSDNRFAIKFREKINFEDLGEEIVIQQRDTEGSIFRKISLINPRWDSFVEGNAMDLIDCRYWREDIEDPYYKSPTDEMNSLLK